MADQTQEQLLEAIAEYAPELIESILDLELSIEDKGWTALGRGVLREQEFSKGGLDQLVTMCRTMALKNPLIKRAVSVQKFYVWAQGVTIKGNKPNIDRVLQEFINDEDNQTELFSIMARQNKEVEMQTDGNLFLVLHTDRAFGIVKIRSFPFHEINDIIMDPDDNKRVLYYKRIWESSKLDLETGVMTHETKTAYYPHWKNKGQKGRPVKIGTHPVEWDRPIYHVKLNSYSDWKWGVPEIYAAVDWALAYKRFLERWSILADALSRYAWKMTGAGNERGVAKAKTKLQANLISSSGLNPAETPGSTFVAGGNVGLEPIRTAGVQMSADDARRLLLMVAASTDLSETFFGDVDVGNHATATTLDRPTELKFVNRQELWKQIFLDLGGYNHEVVRAAPLARARLGSFDAKVDFPKILERNSLNVMNAYAQATRMVDLPLEYAFRRILEALGESDVDAVVEQARADGLLDEKTTKTVDSLSAQNIKNPQPTPGGDGSAGTP